MDFPIFTTKIEGKDKLFDLTDAKQRREYFEYKAGPQIQKLRDYLKTNTFIVYFLGKKSSGKGTYAKMFQEVVAPEKIAHLSVGDLVRSFDGVVKDPTQRLKFEEFLEKNYRGPVSVKDIISAIEGRSTKSLLPSELILALAERQISQLGKKAIFIDGFPRDIDQVSYSLFFKHLVDYRNDPDIFVLIDVPTQVINERIIWRLVCPICQTSRNLKLLPTKRVGYDASAKAFYLLCDNSDCPSLTSGMPARLVTKEGDEHGIEPIRPRLQKDEELMGRIYNMHGIQKILLRNSIPAAEADKHFDNYELTPEYHYAVDPANNITTTQTPWTVDDDNGVASNSLTPAPVVVHLIHELVKALGL